MKLQEKGAKSNRGLAERIRTGVGRAELLTGHPGSAVSAGAARPSTVTHSWAAPGDAWRNAGPVPSEVWERERNFSKF